MKKKINFDLKLKDLLNNKKFTLTISFLLSFILWLSITVTNNPIRDQVFTDISATISIDNTAASELGLGVVSDVASQKFTVTVSGPNYIVSSLKAEDFLLSIPVTDVNSAGTYTLDVMGNRNSSKTGYNFKSISPSTIDVTFDYIDTKEFNIIPKLIGVSAADGLIAENPIVSNSEQSTISIKGPRTVVEKIDTVGTYYEVNKTLDSTQSYDADVVLYDADGEIIYRYMYDGSVVNKSGETVTNSYLTLSYTNVKITQPISKKINATVKPSFTNLPSGISEKDLSYSLNHRTVTIIGTPDVVNGIEEISLAPIDFANISSANNEFEVTAILPDGVKLLDNIEFFTVKIDTSSFAEVIFNVSDIRCIGIGSSLTPKTDSRIKNVKICGPSSVIKNLTSSDLYAVLDLTDKTEGNHTINAVIKSDKYNNIWAVGSYSASVSIK